jgi:hypothetical protein
MIEKIASLAADEASSVLAASAPDTGESQTVFNRPFFHVKPFTKGVHLSQVYSSGLEFAHVNAAGDQVTPLAFCKDYLHDAVWASVNKKPVSIYGMTYDGKTPELSHDAIRLLLTYARKSDFLDMMDAVEEMINQIEDVLQVKPSRIRPVIGLGEKYSAAAAVVQGSNRWLIAPPMVSFYSLAIRIGCVHKRGTNFMETFDKVVAGSTKGIQSSDQGQLQRALPGIKKILSFGYRRIFHMDIAKNYPPGIDASTLHNSMGICAVSGNSSYGPKTDAFSHWTKKLGEVNTEEV